MYHCSWRGDRTLSRCCTISRTRVFANTAEKSHGGGGRVLFHPSALYHAISNSFRSPTTTETACRVIIIYSTAAAVTRLACTRSLCSKGDTDSRLESGRC